MHSALPFESYLGCSLQVPGTLDALWVYSHHWAVPLPTFGLIQALMEPGSVRVALVSPELAAFGLKKVLCC